MAGGSRTGIGLVAGDGGSFTSGGSISGPGGLGGGTVGGDVGGSGIWWAIKGTASPAGEWCSPGSRQATILHTAGKNYGGSASVAAGSQQGSVGVPQAVDGRFVC